MTPKTTVEFLDAISAQEGDCSDYRLAKLLGLKQQQVSNYRNKGGTFSDGTAIRAAELLKIDPAYILLCMHQERAKEPEEKAVWASMLERLGGLAASFALVFFCATPTPSHAGIGSIHASSSASYCFQKRREPLLKRLSQIFGFGLTGL